MLWASEIAARGVELSEQRHVGYRLTTAEIIYRLPDQPDELQTFVWQKFDLAPDFPELSKFLQFWRDNIDGELHSVRVGQGNGGPRRFPFVVPGTDTRH